MDDSHVQPLELTILMPCLNEAETLAVCIRKARGFLERTGISGEVVIADNGSTDGSQAIAEELGARVVPVPALGYGAALIGGIRAARGRYVIMGDSDDSYDFAALEPYVEKLRDGYDLVMGNRFAGGIRPGAMPRLHRYFGNPLLTRIGQIFFKSPCGDFYCGLRGFRKDAYDEMHLQCRGMEFALEMLVKATLFNMKVAEVPTVLWPDGRDRPPHLRSWRDGWRSLRFYLLYSPRWLFYYPGMMLMLLGIAFGLFLLPGPRNLGGITLDVHSLSYCATAVVLGYQAVLFSVFAKAFAIGVGLHPPSASFERRVNHATLEAGLVLGFLLGLGGLMGTIVAFTRWSSHGFGDLDPFQTMRIVIPSVLLMTLGCQTTFASFFLGLLQMQMQVQGPRSRPRDSDRQATRTGGDAVGASTAEAPRTPHHPPAGE